MNNTKPKNNGQSGQSNPSPSNSDDMEEISAAYKQIESKTKPIKRPPIYPHVDGEELVNDLKVCLNRHLVLPDHTDIVIALWIIHTYIYEYFNATPYLLINSPTHECGKTNLLTCLEQLSSSAEHASDLSVAILYRLVEQENPTLLLDEGRELLTHNKIMKLLRKGYKKGGKVYRVDPATKRTVRFNTFCPKAVAQIGRYESVLLSRGIEITMQRNDDSHIENIFNFDQFDDLQNRILRWSIDHVEAICNTSARLPDVVNGRNAEIWTPLLKIGRYIGGDIADEVRNAAIELTQLKTNQREDTPIELLRDVKRVFEHRNCSRIWSRDLVRDLKDIDEAPWTDIGLTTNKLARRLHAFQISSKNMRINGSKKVRKGYSWQMFKDVFENYLDY